MWYPSPNFFLLILEVSPYLILNIVQKRSKVFETFLEEDFKVVLKPKTKKAEFVVILLKANCFPKKWDYKKFLIVASYFSNIKVVLILSIEVIIFHVSFLIIQVWEPGFQLTFPKSFKLYTPILVINSIQIFMIHCRFLFVN